MEKRENFEGFDIFLRGKLLFLLSNLWRLFKKYCNWGGNYSVRIM